MGRRRRPVRTNQAYKVDSTWEMVALAARFVGWLSRRAWQWRTELGFTLPLVTVWLPVRHLIGPRWALLPVAAVLAAVAGWPQSRSWVLGRLACARTRRRVVAVLRETRVADSRDRLPTIKRSERTPVGERLLLSCRAGQSAELLAGRMEELRAGARCRDVTISRDPARADRVTVEVIRRDLLAAGSPIGSPLLARARALFTPPPRTPEPTGPKPKIDPPPAPAEGTA